LAAEIRGEVLKSKGLLDPNKPATPPA
jgi:hypothetical protein